MGSAISVGDASYSTKAIREGETRDMNLEQLGHWVRERYAEAGRLAEFTHLERVARVTRSRADSAVAWFHDIVEDDIATLDDIKSALARMSEFTDAEIASISASVETLRRRKSAGESYTDYIQRIIERGDDRAIRVKQLDIIDHLDPYHRHGLRRDQAARYLDALDVIVDATLQGDHQVDESKIAEPGA
jgi:hypothetical protein